MAEIIPFQSVEFSDNWQVSRQLWISFLLDDGFEANQVEQAVDLFKVTWEMLCSPLPLHVFTFQIPESELPAGLTSENKKDVCKAVTQAFYDQGREFFSSHVDQRKRAFYSILFIYLSSKQGQ